MSNSKQGYASQAASIGLAAALYSMVGNTVSTFAIPRRIAAGSTSISACRSGHLQICCCRCFNCDLSSCAEQMQLPQVFI